MFPRSIVGWFALCWGLFLIAAIIVGIMLVALYKETTSQRIERAQTTLVLSCDAILNESARLPVAREGSGVAQALEAFKGVEGGVWQAGTGSLSYAFPSYEGSGVKTDLPQAEEPTIRQVAETTVSSNRPVAWKREGTSQILLIQGCPFADKSGRAAWTMMRVVNVAERPFLLVATGLSLLLVVLLGSAALLGRVLWRWSLRLRAIEKALAAGSQDLPLLAVTGQRDLDRIVHAINGAGAAASDARRSSERLQKQVAAAERLAALGRVAAGVAHEIRNPITAMRLKAENALAEPGDPSRARNALSVVVDQVARMEQLLQNLLRSVQSSKVDRQEVSAIRDFLSQRISLFAEQAGKRKITLEAPAELPCPLFLDASQIGRAVDNLLLNAIQNSADGTTIAVRARATDDRVAIAVEDHGFGVPDDVRDHLFEPFATGRAEGTGLGLAIVREIAEAHGGQVLLEHRDDGTTFTIDLPCGAPT